MKSTTPAAFGILLFFFSCNNNAQQNAGIYHPDIEEAIGYVIPPDSLAPPSVVKAGKPKVVVAGTPSVTFSYSNISAARKPEMLTAPDPNVITPGEYGYALPDTAIAVNH